MACLELRYSVKIRPQMKDERKDTTAPIVLSDLTPDDELDDAEYNLEGTGKEEEEGVSNMDEGESEKEGEGGGDMERRYSSKYEKLKRGMRLLPIYLLFLFVSFFLFIHLFVSFVCLFLFAYS